MGGRVEFELVSLDCIGIVDDHCLFGSDSWKGVD